MKTLSLTAAITLQAASGGKPRRFSILAYSGGTLNVSGFSFPVVIDLAGLDATAAVPIVLNHETTTDSTLGQTSSISNDGRSLTLAGNITGVSQRVRDVLAQSDAGHVWQASVGCSVVSQQEIPAGQSVQVNGRTFAGPLIVARQSVLRETSVLPVGADSTTQVNLAARAASLKGSHMPMTAPSMTFDEWLIKLGIEPSSISPELQKLLTPLFDAEQNGTQPPSPAAAAAIIDLRAASSADHQRIAKINAVCGSHHDVAAAAIQHGWSPDKTELELFKRITRGIAPMNHQATTASPESAQILSASFAITCGASPKFVAKQTSDAIVHEAVSVQHRGATLRTVMEHTLQAAGVSIPSHTSGDAFIRAAFQASQTLEASAMSTLSLPGILSNSANKLLLEGYLSVTTSWNKFCAVGNLNDLKLATRYRLTTSGDFEEVGPGGEIKHMSLNKEDAYTVQGKTYATLVNLSRTDIINDDLSAFSSLPVRIGRMAAIKLERLLYTLLLGSGAAAFFSTANGNKLTGSGSALSITALTAAAKAFLNQIDANGDPVLLTPELLLVPPSLSVTANQLIRDTQVVAVGVGTSAAVQPDGNPHAGRFEAVISPWLENAKVAGASSTGWYLFAKPQGSAGALEVSFLNGQANPTIEHGALDFSQLGVSLRGYHDFSVAFQDPKFGVYNSGV